MSGTRIGKRQFRTADDLYLAVADLLQERFIRSFGRPHGVMLSGGRTPLPVYVELARRRIRVSDDLHILFSDERMVPPDSPESNYGNVRPMLRNILVSEERILRVDTGMPVKAAAAHYDKALQHFFKCGGRVSLGLLGLGADGHTASIFTPDAARAGGVSYAMAVNAKDAPSRVTVTANLLKRVEAIIFLAVGGGKRDVVSRLLSEPDKITAGLAVRESPAVQVWVA